MKGLLIKFPHIDNILNGQKTWEIRGRRSNEINTTIALIKSGSGTVVGKCRIVAVHGPLTRVDMEKHASKHLIDQSRISEVLRRYNKCYAWELTDIVKLTSPVPYEHKSGAVIWVSLAPTVAQQIVGS